MVISSKNVLPYLISKNIVGNEFLGYIVEIKELYNSSNNKIIIVQNGINSFVLKQFLILDKNTNRLLVNEITGFENFSDGELFSDEFNKILIFKYKGILKNFSRYSIASYWDLKHFYNNLLPKINEIHSKITLKNIELFKPKIIDSIHFLFYVNSFATQNFYNLSIISKLIEYEEMIKRIENEWNFSSIIHGDFKIENVIENNKKLYLIDFESIALGDKCWDFANMYYSTSRHFIPPIDSIPDINIIGDFNYLISNYLISILDINSRENEAKKICIYALLIHIQNFLICTKQKLWDEEKIFREYRKIILKWQWFENTKDPNYSYINQLIQ